MKCHKGFASFVALKMYFTYSS